MTVLISAVAPVCYNDYMNKYKRPLIYLGLVIIIALTIFYTTGCGSSGNQSSDNVESPGKDLTAFVTTDIDGSEVDQSIFADHDMTLVNFWATFCGPCIQEMPYLAEINNDPDGEGINIVGIALDVQDQNLEVIDENVNEAHAIINETGADYPHLMNSQDIQSEMIVPYNIQSIPTTFIVDNTGKVIGGPYVGSKNKADWLGIIKEVR